TPQKNRLYFELISAYADGSFLWSIGAGVDLQLPPTCRVQRQPGATPMQLFKLHEQALKSDQRLSAALPAATPEQAISVSDALHEAVRSFHVSRRLFVPISGADLQRR